MIKRTLLFGNPAYLKTKNNQLVVRYPEEDQPERTVPIEDIGIMVLEHPQITISNRLLDLLAQKNVVVVTCDQQHLPTSLTLPLSGHTEYNERLRYQLEASLPLKKNLWQQTVERKIRNQLAVLLEGEGMPLRVTKKMQTLVTSVLSGDTQNNEGQAAAIYWEHLFAISAFTRGRKENAPNNLLNYGYAILRAVSARSIIGSGMLPVLGIFHANKYNSFCLADDIMEPYRPYVDALVRDIIHEQEEVDQLTPQLKQQLLRIPALDVVIEGKKVHCWWG